MKIEFELEPDDWDLLEYLQSFSGDRDLAIKAAIREQMASQNLDEQILEKLSSVDEQLKTLMHTVANLRVQTVQGMSLQGQYPEAETNLKGLVDF